MKVKKVTKAKRNNLIRNFDDLPNNKKPMEFEDWKESDLYIPALLKYYDVDTEEELADCNISEKDIIDIYNEYNSNGK